MTRRARRKPLEIETDVISPRPRRWRRRLIVAGLLLAVLVALAPTIVCVTPLWRVVVGAVLPADAGKLDIDKLSVGWVTPIGLQGITLTEPDGEKVVEVEHVQISRSLVDLVLASRSLGTIRVDRPHVYCKVRPDGSNVEDLAAKLAKAFEEKTPDEDDDEKRPTRFRFELIDGTIETTDVATGNKWFTRNLNVTLDRTAAELAAMEFSAAGQIGPPPIEGAAPLAAGPDQPGSFAVTVDPIDDKQQHLRLRTMALPLAAVEPWCRRFDSSLQLMGWLTGEGSATWTLPKAAENPERPELSFVEQVRDIDWTTSGQFVLEQLVVSSTALEGDRLAMQSVQLPWSATNRGGTIRVEELQLRAPVGTVWAKGSVGSDELTELNATQFLQLKDYEIQSNVDLAGIAKLLPRVLQVRPDTSIASGRAAMTLRSQVIDQNHVLTGDLRTADLAANRGGQMLRWDQPIRANFTLRNPATEFQLESLHCDSEFLQFDASGNVSGLKGKLNLDLDRLAQQLGQFVDLGDWTLQGTGAADFNWGTTAPGQFTAKLNGDLTQLQVTHAGHDLFREPKLQLEGTVIGDRPAESPYPTRLASGEFSLRSDSDELQASLVSPVDLTVANWSCPVTANLSGNIASWLLRLRPFMNTDQWTVEGTIAGELAANVGPTAIRVSKGDLKLTNLRAASPDWLIIEPQVALAGSGSWDAASGLIQVPDATFVTSTISGRAGDVRLPIGGTNTGQANGIVAIRADLGRLSTWRTRAANPSSWSFAGQVVGTARIQRTDSQVAADLDLTGDNLQLQDLAGGAARVVWQEPQVKVVGNAAYDPNADRIGLDNLQVTSNMLRLATTGSIEEFSTVGRAQLASKVDYDLAQITPLLAPFVGRGVSLAGKHQGLVELNGQLADPTGASTQHWSQRWQGRFNFPWTGASLYGLNVGAGNLAGTLANGVATIAPIEATVGEGRFSASPLVRLDPPPSLATLKPGQLVSNVRITPEVSNTLLKYIAPALADATRSEGLFTLRLDQTSVPLGDAAKADIAGELHIQSAQVQPGPMFTQWTGVAREIEALVKGADPATFASRSPTTLMSITDRRVRFRLVDGRVHSEGFECQVGDLTIRSRGSVGLDETLQLTVEVPLQDGWLENRPVLKRVVGESIQIPVAGTFRQPQIDRRVLRDLLRDTAQQAIGNELNRALEGLFKPRQ